MRDHVGGNCRGKGIGDSVPRNYLVTENTRNLGVKNIFGHSSLRHCQLHSVVHVKKGISVSKMYMIF